MKGDFRHKPEWLKVRLPRGFKAEQVVGLLNEKHIHTICSSGMCPNRGECWSRGTATFMIGGNVCTRNCRFCNVTTGRPQPLDEAEIEEIVGLQIRSIQKMLSANGITLEVTSAALKFLAEEGYDPEFGARPVKRVIHRMVLNQLSKDILAQKVDREHPIVIDYDGNDIIFKN